MNMLSKLWFTLLPLKGSCVLHWNEHSIWRQTECVFVLVSGLLFKGSGLSFLRACFFEAEIMTWTRGTDMRELKRSREPGDISMYWALNKYNSCFSCHCDLFYITAGRLVYLFSYRALRGSWEITILFFSTMFLSASVILCMTESFCTLHCKYTCCKC